MTDLAPQACDLIIEAGWVVPVVPHGVVLTDHAVVVSGGEIVAVLPLAEVRSRIFGHALTSQPFCVYGGIAADVDAGPDVIHELESKAETIARALGVKHLEYRNLQLRHEDWRIEYGYDRDDPAALPVRLFAERSGAFELRLRIDGWSALQVQEESP